MLSPLTFVTPFPTYNASAFNHRKRLLSPLHISSSFKTQVRRCLNNTAPIHCKHTVTRSASAHRNHPPSDDDFTYFATCARGLGEILATELRSSHIGAEVLHVASSGVRFRSRDANPLVAYNACLWLRTATRVLQHINTVSLPSVHTARDAAYDAVKTAVDWPTLLDRGSATFSLQVRVASTRSDRRPGREDRNDWRGDVSQRVVQLRIKDAICDCLRDAGLQKPPPPDNHAAANVPLFITLYDNSLSIYRDLAAASLHKRGYRSDAVMHRGSLNESVAAAMLYVAGFTPEGGVVTRDGRDLTADGDSVRVVDPMCGSGTLLVEAALLYLQVAVGLYRRSPFPFENWPDFDATLYDTARRAALAAQRDDDPRAISSKLQLIGNDRNASALRLAVRDVNRTRLNDMIQLRQCEVRDLHLKEAPTLVVCNPPWGRRLEHDDAWADLGVFLKEEAAGSTAVLLSGDAMATRALRLKATSKLAVRVGNVDTRIVVYDLLPKLARTDRV